MKQKTKSKALIILNIILLLTLFTIPVYAYWANNLKAPLDKTDGTEIIIGEAADVETVITLDKLNENYGVLVPAGRAREGQVEKIEFNLGFVWEEATDDKFTEGTNHLGTLTLDYAVTGTDLLKVEFDAPKEIQLGKKYVVAVTITLTEPATQADYNKLQTEKDRIGVTFTFSVVPNQQGVSTP